MVVVAQSARDASHPPQIVPYEVVQARRFETLIGVLLSSYYLDCELMGEFDSRREVIEVFLLLDEESVCAEIV